MLDKLFWVVFHCSHSNSGQTWSFSVVHRDNLNEFALQTQGEVLHYGFSNYKDALDAGTQEVDVRNLPVNV